MLTLANLPPVVDIRVATSAVDLDAKLPTGRQRNLHLDALVELSVGIAHSVSLARNALRDGDISRLLRAIDAHGITWSASPTNDWVAGDWRDIISVPRNGSVVVRWRPTLHTGLLLHHCHVYNHESAGLKEMIMVVNCSAGAIAKLNAHGNDVWPWAGQDCTNMCTDESMDMTG